MMKMFLIDAVSDKVNCTVKCEIINCINLFGNTIKINENSIIEINYKNPKNIKVKCNCKDYKQSNTILFFFKTPKYCDHIKWFGLYYLHIMYVSFWSVQSIKNFINKYIPESDKNGNNDECVVCLEDINYKNQAVYNCITCKNSVHIKCWNLYLISSSRQYINLQKCSVCRTSYLPCILK